MTIKQQRRDVVPQPLQELGGEWNNWRRIENIEAALANLDARIKVIERLLSEMSAYLGR